MVVATATLALQRQLVERDLPRTVDALHPLLRRRPQYAMLKGRSNYLCLHRLHEGMPQDEEEGLFDQFEAATPTSKLGQDLLRLRDWTDGTETGDRDDLTPGVSDRAWAQVSVSSRECLGAQKCAYGAECFAEMARERAKLAEVVVTNHALLAIDAIEGAPVLPQHEVLIVDEAHELVSRVTGVATGELTPGQVNRAVRRAAKLANEKAADQLQTAAEGFERLMELALPGRLEEIPEDLGYALMALRDACRTVISAIGATRDKSVQDEDAVRKQALASVESVHDVAERITNGSEWDVVWYERHDRFGASLRVAPMSVSGLLREKLFADRSVTLTSATLKLGGDFNGVGASLGLAPEGTAGEDLPQWKGVDVGSPFDYPKQGILYVAKHLARPARDGDRADMLDELTELIQAAGGRTLGLFSSMRGAQLAAEELRSRIPEYPILLQGEETLGELIKNFAADPKTCLFGTLSLWQGVDVPGASCQLVVMDKIPFPRPDDPLMSARQKAVEDAGGNGFMAVAATHAALLMAQEPAVSSVRRATGVWSPSSTSGWPRLATAAISRRHCPTSGTPRTVTRPGGRWRRSTRRRSRKKPNRQRRRPNRRRKQPNRRDPEGVGPAPPGRPTDARSRTAQDPGTGAGVPGSGQGARPMVPARRGRHTRRSTATTLPRIVASSPGIGSYAELCGRSQTWPSSRLKRLTVASPSSMAATMSPFSATGWRRTVTQSPSQIAASIIESPTTFRTNSSPSPTSWRGRGKTSSTDSSARIGPPAAIRPTNGTYDAAGLPAVSVGCTDEDWSEPRTSYARGRCGSRRRKPLRSSAISWCATEDVLDRPTAWPISRIDGGYPRRCTESLMTSITRRCRSVSPELSARIPGGRPGRERLCPSGFAASFIACTGSSRPWERSWAVMVALSAVVVTSAPLDGLPAGQR